MGQSMLVHHVVMSLASNLQSIDRLDLVSLGFFDIFWSYHYHHTIWCYCYVDVCIYIYIHMYICILLLDIRLIYELTVIIYYYISRCSTHKISKMTSSRWSSSPCRCAQEASDERGIRKAWRWEVTAPGGRWIIGWLGYQSWFLMDYQPLAEYES